MCQRAKGGAQKCSFALFREGSLATSQRKKNKEALLARPSIIEEEELMIMGELI